MHTQYYTFADIKLRIISAEKLDITAESLPFLTDDPDNVDLTVTVRPVTALPEPSGGVWDNGRCFSGNTVLHCNGTNHPPYARVTYEENRDITIEYLTNAGADLFKTSGLISTLGLERMLLSFGALILHASFVSWKEGGILFTAPSGTGKSTQAELWRRFAGADVLNGDRACLRRRDGRWMAYGIPYAGSSDIYRNESVPIRAIVSLRQAPENRIRRMGLRECIGSLLPELSVHRWDPAFVNGAMDLAMELMQQIPVYRLECRPDEEAVQVLKKQITEEGNT